MWRGYTLLLQALLLENTRFHAGDAGNDPAFAAALAATCHVFVNDAFGVVHRDQGSVTVGGVACGCVGVRADTHCARSCVSLAWAVHDST